MGGIGFLLPAAELRECGNLACHGWICFRIQPPKCSLDHLKDPTPESKLEYNPGQGSGEVEIAVKTALHIVDVHVSVTSLKIDVAS